MYDDCAMTGLHKLQSGLSLIIELDVAECMLLFLSGACKAVLFWGQGMRGATMTLAASTITLTRPSQTASPFCN